MKMFTLIPLLTALLFIACSKNGSPTSPKNPSNMIILNGYSVAYDSAYYEVWSDSSWEAYYQDTVLNGRSYIAILSSGGDIYYYGTAGYSGFLPYGGSLILFDKPIASLPDTLELQKKYNTSTTFTYGGYGYTLSYQWTLRDTVSVGVPFGVFDPCLWFTVVSQLSSGGQTVSADSDQSWSAKGPGTIKQVLDSAYTIVMVRGVVNGKGWGVQYPAISKSSAILRGRGMSTKPLRFVSRVLHVGGRFRVW